MVLARLGAIIVLVTDMKRSIDFYQGLIGLPLNQQSLEWTEFFNGGTVLALHPAKRKDKIKASPTILVGFMVNDLENSVKRLKEKGVKFFKEPRQEPFGKHAIFEDPDEHLISIVQLETKSAEGFDLLGFVGAE